MVLCLVSCGLCLLLSVIIFIAACKSSGKSSPVDVSNMTIDDHFVGVQRDYSNGDVLDTAQIAYEYADLIFRNECLKRQLEYDLPYNHYDRYSRTPWTISLNSEREIWEISFDVTDREKYPHSPFFVWLSKKTGKVLGMYWYP